MADLTGGEIVQIILALSTLLMSAGAVIVSLRNSSKITEVHQLTNSKMDQLVEEVRRAATAKGNLEGRAELKVEDDRRSQL